MTTPMTNDYPMMMTPMTNDNDLLYPMTMTNIHRYFQAGEKIAEKKGSSCNERD
jgi:hypothetical protein